MASGRSENDKREEPAGPAAELVKERETFVRTFLKKGVEFTEELIRDNQQLRTELARLQADNAKLLSQVASGDAIRELLKAIDALEQERSQLVDRARELERVSEQQRDRYFEMEGELNDLASLYIASFQLHGTLSLQRVMDHISDMLYQFVGAKAFVIYLVQADEALAVPVSWARVEEELLKPEPVGGGVVGDVCLTGVPFIKRDAASGGTLESPLAAVPLLAEGQAVGVISVIELFQQKQTWASVDEELFRLLATHACTALIAANLYSGDEGPRAALRGVKEKLVRDREPRNRKVASADLGG